MIEMKVDGLDKILAALKQLPDELSEQYVQEVFTEMVQPTLQRARELAPVDTGFLRSKITVIAISANGLVTVQVGVFSSSKAAKAAGRKRRAKIRAVRGAKTSAFYARYLENGTKKMQARPFLRPAFDETVKGFVEGVGSAVGKKIEEHWRSSAA